MPAPTPAIPSFVDGSVVHQADLNALASNLTNLFNENQGGFRTQRDCVITTRTTLQTINNSTDTLISFSSASVNTNNMWTASQPTQITIQTAGIYWIFGQVRWPVIAGSTQAMGMSGSILVNGTSYLANGVAAQLCAPVNAGSGISAVVGCLVNLAVGAVVYLNAWQNTGAAVTTNTDGGGTFLGAIFLTPSS